MVNLFKSKKEKNESITKIVVLGHQKSGTTVIAKLLGKISCLKISSDPLYKIDRGRAEVTQKLINQPESLISHCQNRPKLFHQPIVKDPDFTFIYPWIKNYYKNARFLFIIRDPRDTIRSICNRLGLTSFDMNTEFGIPEMKRGTRHWELILSGQLPKNEETTDLSFNIVQHLAYRWNKAAAVYLENAHEIELVRYEDFLTDKVRFIHTLASKLGLPVQKSISRYVNVQYQPKGNSDVEWKDFFGEENLSMIEDICSEYMSFYGYEPEQSLSFNEVEMGENSINMRSDEVLD